MTRRQERKGPMSIQSQTATGRTPIDQCQTITTPGAYVLTKNLQATGDCLVIGTSFVTLDFERF